MFWLHRDSQMLIIKDMEIQRQLLTSSAEGTSISTRIRGGWESRALGKHPLTEQGNRQQRPGGGPWLAVV